MNKRFNDYLSTLTPKKRDLAAEAVLEFLKGESSEVTQIYTASQIFNSCRDMCLLDVEHFDVILLNQNYRVIKRVNISKGGITEVSVDIRIIFRECLLNNATALICVHNHPSGNLKPSKCDNDLTTSINKASQIMRIKLLDHVIISDGAYYSYKEDGKL